MRDQPTILPEGAELIGYRLKLSKHEYHNLQNEQNKDYVAGLLMGRLSPFWSVPKKEEVVGK